MTHAKDRLSRAQADFDEAERCVQAAWNRALDEIIGTIPDRVDRIGHEAAHAAPEITRQLGRDGVNSLRTELAATATALATMLDLARGEINIIHSRSDVVHTSLYSFLYKKPELTSIGKTLVAAGYSYPRDYPLPQFLYGRTDSRLSKATAAREDTRGELAKATRIVDAEAVNDLWS